MAPNDIELRALSSDTQEQRPVVPKHGVGETSTSPRSSITAQEQHTKRIHTRLWPVLLFLVYAVFALFPWVTLCILNKRPSRSERVYGSYVSHGNAPWYNISKEFYQAARRMQSFATLLTIPVTTSICSTACVVYMQSSPLRRGLTLRQSMALADSDWLSGRILEVGGNAGSLPLYTAFALTLLGSVGQILQTAFLEPKSILANSPEPHYTYVYDTLPLINGTLDSGSDGRHDFDQRTLDLRSLFESPFKSDDDINNWGVPYHIYQDYLSDPIDAGHTYIPLSRNFSSGAFPIQQFAPRINSSIASFEITETEFKDNCRNETDNGGFYARYLYVESSSTRQSTHDYSFVDFEVCMTNDLRISPWNSTDHVFASSATRDRQELTEKLYYKTLSDARGNLTYWKLTSNTSLGYFEVPSAQNGHVSGPLLDKDPFANDKFQIEANRRENYDKISPNIWRKVENISYSGNDTMSLARSNKGPLASVATALFGPYSYIDTRMSNPSNFIVATDLVSDQGAPSGNCVYREPLSSWLASVQGRCLDSQYLREESRVIYRVGTMLEYYFSSPKAATLGALSHGLYMANKLWMYQPSTGYPKDNQLIIYYDDGIPLIMPEINNAGVIVGSIFLASHLLGLLLLVVYIAIMKPWSSTMGSEVMLKMGMVYSDELARSETEQQWEKAVTTLPGFIGDEKPVEEVGRMRLGATAGLSRKKGRKFEILR